MRTNLTIRIGYLSFYIC